MSSILYADSGGLLEDKHILKNAVYFSTAQRVFSAKLLLQHNLGVSNQILSYLVVKAFEEFMTSTEDLIGWIFVLEYWKPGNAEYSLINLLDKTQVGKIIKGKNYTEERAISILSKLDVEGFRKFVHIPTDSELKSTSIDKTIIERINKSMPYKLDGWLKMANKRAEQDRGYVRAFNKLKHLMLAVPTQERGKNEVWLPSSIRFYKNPVRVGIGNVWIEISANHIRELAGNAIAAQTVLHDTLATILHIRYNEEYIAPQWAVETVSSDYMLRS